ncbi:class I SAM-dependent methyltransferase [Burkholderia oklahomensis]|uniref:class I SAM-dependent methyltransferase n=1 Tax=Burkholderia oklahomensis TaxID=342113 RepID=UPI00264C1191|nr:class I SAM-dependent methyltransferase [Burkholderia oklahomensis]MDN7674897.1 class I SAM-dependent methyltransferase [Burkholderia oklahomensis]
MTDVIEFAGNRSTHYKDALLLYPDAWRQDIECMRRFLRPSPGEKILEIGGGSGYFSRAISAALGPSGRLVVTDPSIEQVDALRGAPDSNIRVVQQAADALHLDTRDFDAVWSRGAIHHVTDKASAFAACARHVRPGARLVIYDIFADTPLARYFDGFIAKSCSTGHEAAFLSEEFAKTLCALTGWSEPRFCEVTVPWEFDSRKAIGHFLRLLFSATDAYSDADCLAAAETFLSVSTTRAGHALMWPMTVMVAQRLA